MQCAVCTVIYAMKIQFTFSMICEFSERQDSNLQRAYNSILSFCHFNGGISGCTTDSDCPDHLECKNDGDCVKPSCPECGSNAQCKGINHTGNCVCNSGYPIGDPYQGCSGKQTQLISKED